MPEIFISHSHRDAVLAGEFQNFIETISSNRLPIQRSSKQGSIEYGDSWIDWIHEKVQKAQVTFVLLTPSSFSSPWVLWEAGAVAGVKRAKDERAKDGRAEDEIGQAGDLVKRRVIPVKFATEGPEGWGPFQGTQIADGLDVDQMVALGESILEDLRGTIENKLVNSQLTKLQATCGAHVEKVRALLARLQIDQREDLVAEWVSRIDRAYASKDYAIARPARRWINIAFLGPGSADKQTPIDFRIHTRLAEGFRRLGQWNDARQQLLCARALSPRDMMVLRELGRVELELKHPSEATGRFNEMYQLDPEVFTEDEEALNLRVRVDIERDDWPSALNLLDATELAKTSAYVANMKAIATMKVRGAGAAEGYFRQLREIEKKIGSQGIWSKANLVNAALALGDRETADTLLEELKASSEARDNKVSIARYFDEIVQLRKSQDPSFDYDWKVRWP